MISERLLHGVNTEHAPKEEQEEIIGALAHALDTQWLLMKGQDRSQEFLARIYEFVDVHSLPSFFYTQRGERRPPFPEAVRETVRRLTLIETFVSSPPPTVVGEICGGSMSYGRFYNVHRGPTPSDIDFILVVDSSFFQSEDPEHVVSHERGFKREEAALFQKRCQRFAKLYREEKVHILSQKFTVDEYLFSLKVIPLPVFLWEFVDLPLGIIRERTMRKVPILDYKPAPYPDKDSLRKNFFNDTFIFHGREEPLPFDEVITEVPAAVFHNGTFYTGDHHNHVLPKLEILFDKDESMRKAFDAFHSALQEEFDFALKMVNNNRTADAMYIMDRAPVFSPQTVEEARRLFTQ